MAQQLDEFARQHPTQEHHETHGLRLIAPCFSAVAVEVKEYAIPKESPL